MSDEKVNGAAYQQLEVEQVKGDLWLSEPEVREHEAAVDTLASQLLGFLSSSELSPHYTSMIHPSLKLDCVMLENFPLPCSQTLTCCCLVLLFFFLVNELFRPVTWCLLLFYPSFLGQRGLPMGSRST